MGIPPSVQASIPAGGISSLAGSTPQTYCQNTDLDYGAADFNFASQVSPAERSVVDTYIYGAQYNVLSGWNFAGQNLTNVSFYLTKLRGAEFTNTQIRGAVYS
jgi:uncharacterized protein YjbI with pentapeptide repeats